MNDSQDIILCLILISQLWPKTEENTNIIQLFLLHLWVFYYIQTATENYSLCKVDALSEEFDLFSLHYRLS